LLETLKDEVEGCPRSEKDIYAKLINSARTYIGTHKHEEGLCFEDRSSKNDKKSTLKVELNPLSLYLRYEFLSPNQTLSVIVSEKLDDSQIEKLLNVLRKYKGSIDYSIDDISGVSPSVCMHRIHLDDRQKPSRQSQRRLNPNMQEVVKKEVVKLHWDHLPHLG